MNLTNEIPYDAEAEKGLLSGVIINNEIFNEYCDGLEPEDFYYSSHSKIYNAIRLLSFSSTPIDVITLAAKLKEVGHITEIGGEAYLANILSCPSSSINCSEYSRIIKDLSARRKVLKALNECKTLAQGQSSTIEDLARIEKLVFDATQAKQNARFVNMESLMPALIDEFEQRSTRGMDNYVLTGFRDLDSYLNGLRPGQLIIIAAQPGMGKTSLALNIMLNAALKQNKRTLFYSLEMPANEIGERMVSAISQIEADKIRKGNLSANDYNTLYQGADDILKYPIEICDNHVTPIDVLSLTRRKITEVKRSAPEGGIDLLVVDYLQIMPSGMKTESQVAEISAVSNALKRIAKELKIPVIALSQLSKEGYKRNGNSSEIKAPELSDLKGSGSIEADADVVLLLSKSLGPEVDYRAPCEVKVKIAKNRAGSPGTVSLTWIGSFTRFFDYENPDRYPVEASMAQFE